MAVTGYSTVLNYRGYDPNERVAVVTSGAFVGASTNRVGPRPARPVRPPGLGLLADLEDALGLDDLPPLTPTPTRPTGTTGRKTSNLHRRLDLAERRLP